MGVTKSVFLLACAACALVVAVPQAGAAETRSCGRLVNPYPNTRYDGVDLTRIRAKGVSCSRARKVARGAHRRALSLPVRPDGIRRLRWRGWRVRGDLRGPSDHYVARRAGKRVSWRF